MPVSGLPPCFGRGNMVPYPAETGKRRSSAGAMRLIGYQGVEGEHGKKVASKLPDYYLVSQ